MFSRGSIEVSGVMRSGMLPVVQERKESISDTNAGEHLAEAAPEQAVSLNNGFQSAYTVARHVRNQSSKSQFWLYLATKLVFHKLLLPLLPSLMASPEQLSASSSLPPSPSDPTLLHPPPDSCSRHRPAHA